MDFKTVVDAIEFTIERKLNEKEIQGLMKTINYRLDNGCYGGCVMHYDERLFMLVVFDVDDYMIDYVG